MCARSPDHPRDAHIAVHGVEIERTRGERLRLQIAVDRRDRELHVGSRVGQRNVARDALDHRQPWRAFEREVAADALHPDFAFDVGDADVARHRAQLDRRVAGHLDVELHVDAAPISPAGVLHTQLDAVTAGIGFDHRVAEALLRLFGIRPPRVFQRLHINLIVAAGRDLNVPGDVGQQQRRGLGPP